VKEVIEVEGTKLAQKICMPNGRAIWPKFGKNVKDIMKEAKSWNFEELDNWTVLICHPELDSGSIQKIKTQLNNDSESSSEWQYFILEEGDFELVFQAWDSKYEIEAGFGMVIAMDPELNEELKQEWTARDLVRAIQDARKEAEFNVEDRIEISISWENLSEILSNFWEYIENETLSKINSSLENANLEKEIEIGEEKIVIMLKK
jgi:isoleucyl-tRNA synthetase